MGMSENNMPLKSVFSHALFFFIETAHLFNRGAIQTTLCLLFFVTNKKGGDSAGKLLVR